MLAILHASKIQLKSDFTTCHKAIYTRILCMCCMHGSCGVFLISDIMCVHFFRKVKNVDIGIDISVPSREHASAPKNVKKYHVLVITSLPHFKSPVHSEDAVVQFMVNNASQPIVLYL